MPFLQDATGLKRAMPQPEKKSKKAKKPGNKPGPAPARPPETGGPKGPEPTRYGDWERKGRCIDF